MTRKNPERRQELMAAAQHLFFTKGYENASINDLIKEVGVSKGAFYHHFESKQAVLEAIVEGLMAQAISDLQEIISDPAPTALSKCQRALQLSYRWKIAQEDEIVAVGRILRTDANVLLFHKVRAEWLKVITPHVATIIRQGVSEGVFDVPHIEETAAILVTITSALTDAVAELADAPDDSADHVTTIKKHCAALQTTVERLLGAPADSIPIIDENTMIAWLDKTTERSIRG